MYNNLCCNNIRRVVKSILLTVGPTDIVVTSHIGHTLDSQLMQCLSEREDRAPFDVTLELMAGQNSALELSLVARMAGGTATSGTAVISVV